MAKQTPAAPEARELFDPQKPRLGGHEKPLRFTEAQRRMLEAMADTLLPGDGNFPDPSETDLLHYMARYVAREGEEAAYFPFVAEADVNELVDRLGEQFASQGQDERAAALRRFAEESHVVFAKLQALTYYGYYSLPEVARAIRNSGDAAIDYHGAPLPYGYPGTMGSWDEAVLRHGRGHYIATEDVRPAEVDLRGPTADQLTSPRGDLESAEPLPERPEGTA